MLKKLLKRHSKGTAKKALTLVAGLALFSCSDDAAAERNQVRIVGSSTVYPFSIVVAEQFAEKTDFASPIIEATGSGGGFKLFCEGLGEDTPDITNSSRRIKPREFVDCLKSGVKEIIELKIGYDGIVLANSTNGYEYDIGAVDLYYALAEEIPDPNQSSKLIPNYLKTWNDVNPNLPKNKIAVYGPPASSGTRDAFLELVMHKTCMSLPAATKKYPIKSERKKACSQLREDGAYIEAGENDNLIVQKLSKNSEALGIFGYSYLNENRNLVQAAKIDGIYPEYETIASGAYNISRPLYVYAKKAHTKVIDGLQEFLTEMTSSEAIGEEGYLEFRGLISLPDEGLEANQQRVENLEILESLSEEE